MRECAFRGLERALRALPTVDTYGFAAGAAALRYNLIEVKSGVSRAGAVGMRFLYFFCTEKLRFCSRSCGNVVAYLFCTSSLLKAVGAEGAQFARLCVWKLAGLAAGEVLQPLSLRGESSLLQVESAWLAHTSWEESCVGRHALRCQHVATLVIARLKRRSAHQRNMPPTDINRKRGVRR